MRSSYQPTPQLLRILLIRDPNEPDDSSLDILRVCGHRVDTAQSLPKALEILESMRFDLMALEINQAHLGQIDLLRQLGRNLPALPVVVILNGPGKESAAVEAAIGGLCDAPMHFLERRLLAHLPSIVEDLHRLAVLELENRRLSKELHRRRAELESANIRILEQRHRLLSQERLRTVMETARAVGHRLNQPLSVMMGNLELLGLKLTESHPKLKRMASQIVQSGEEISAILSRVTNLLRHRMQTDLGSDYIVDLNHDSWRLLISAPSQDSRQRIIEALRSQRFQCEIVECSNTESTLECLSSAEVDVALLDAHMPEMGGVELIQEIMRHGNRVPLIFLARDDDDQLVSELLRQGASDYLPWSLLSSEVLTQSVCQALRQATIEQSMLGIEDQLLSNAAIDPTTGLASPPRFHSLIAEEFERASRHRRPLSILIFEIDRWGEFIEKAGSEFAEEFLLQTGRALAGRARQSDCLARLSQSRFGAVLPETTIHGAEIFAMRIVEHLGHHLSRDLLELWPESLTISSGIACTETQPICPDGEQILGRAVEALGEALGMGTGHTVAWTTPRHQLSLETG